MKQKIFFAFVLALIVFSFACSGGGKGRRRRAGALGPDAEVLVPGYKNPQGEFEIYVQEQLTWIADQVNNSKNEFPNNEDTVAKLMNDIDLENTGFSGIATGGSLTYNGTFNGNGFIIKNIDITDPSKSSMGFIGKTSSTAVVKNLRIKDSKIVGGSSTAILVGHNEGIIYMCGTGDITDVAAAASAAGDDLTLNQVRGHGENVGAIAGKNSGFIRRSYNMLKVVRQAGGFSHTGGIVGYNTRVVEDSYNLGKVALYSGYAPGIAGYSETAATVLRCYSPINGITSTVLIGDGGGAAASSVTREEDFNNKELLEKDNSWDFSSVWEWENGKTSLRGNK